MCPKENEHRTEVPESVDYCLDDGFYPLPHEIEWEPEYALVPGWGEVES